MIDSTEQTIVRDRADQRTGYRRLQTGPGGDHRARTELITGSGGPVIGEPIARLIHVTDFQLADLMSPSRVEFLQRLDSIPAWQRMLPSYRPQEFLLLHAIEAVVRTIRGRRSVDAPDVDARDVDAVITTGDNTDSAQQNELETFLTLMDGGQVRPGDPDTGLDNSVTASGHPAYWNPEPASDDQWKSVRGLPDHPGALAAAAEPFQSQGLGAPWLACFGNHDCLVQGRVAAPDGYDDFLTGARKPVDRPFEAEPQKPDSSDRPDALDRYLRDPMLYSTGETTGIEALAERRMIDKREYLRMHLKSSGEPAGHGFTEGALERGIAYFSHDDIDGLRVIVLDTTNIAGGVDGCVDEAQFDWLEDQLAGAGDRWVIICSHHGLSTLNNDTGDNTWGGRLQLADEVEALLHRYPQAVLWLSGHTHVNRVTPRSDGAGRGFWEVSTGSIAEWPVQVRELTVSRTESGVAITATMIDSQVPPVPTGELDLADLASLHREVAANDPGSVGGLDAEGEPGDRNVVLFLER